MAIKTLTAAAAATTPAVTPALTIRAVHTIARVFTPAVLTAATPSHSRAMAMGLAVGPITPLAAAIGRDLQEETTEADTRVVEIPAMAIMEAAATAAAVSQEAVTMVAVTTAVDTPAAVTEAVATTAAGTPMMIKSMIPPGSMRAKGMVPIIRGLPNATGAGEISSVTNRVSGGGLPKVWQPPLHMAFCSPVSGSKIAAVKPLGRRDQVSHGLNPSVILPR